MGNKKRKPRKNCWLGESAEVYALGVSFREYGIRLDQLTEVLYEEFCQLSPLSSEQDELPSTTQNLIHANPSESLTNRSVSPVQENVHGKSGNAA